MMGGDGSPLRTCVDAEEEEEPVVEEGQGKREMCWDGCGRPASVCVCAHLPPQPLHTSTTVVVLHHPHELRRNPLATLPLLARCLRRCHTVPGRRLRLGSHPLLDSLYHGHRGDAPSAVFLFPGGRDLGLLATDAAGPPSVLVVFDGTWRQAKEMVAASLPFLEQFATKVSLGCCEPGVEGPSTFESELVLRKEPFKGCVSTMEAVARALRVMEPDGKGAAVEATLLSLLRAMVGFQSCHMKPMKPRSKLRKKDMTMAAGPKKEKENEKENANGSTEAAEERQYMEPIC
ncbi:tRNA-uridine aminocarboxypropyltransferase A [Musa acuminata AAA Group]|uniref:tRNA-uridine aminocarboxypropyltransferase A n=1 Tax=Musa acuminata AAA Group TaxID=214697 RepID=UPI0031D9FEEB